MTSRRLSLLTLLLAPGFAVESSGQEACQFVIDGQTRTIVYPALAPGRETPCQPSASGAAAAARATRLWQPGGTPGERSPAEKTETCQFTAGPLAGRSITYPALAAGSTPPCERQ